MSVVREATAAGRFYPSDRIELRTAVERYLEEAGRFAASPKAIIVPHAGYVYSGPIAASAYAGLFGRSGVVTRVVLMGPAHYVRFAGLALPSADSMETPLGRVPIDAEGAERALRLPQVVINDAAHAREHSLEVHLPFLQRVLGDFAVLPFAVGQPSVEEVSELLELLWGGAETLFVISSDLSHYHDRETVRVLDLETSRMIESLQFEKLTDQRCCGVKAISGLLSAAQRRGLSVRALDLRNSGDTAGPSDRVVGYGAFFVE